MSYQQSISILGTDEWAIEFAQERYHLLPGIRTEKELLDLYHKYLVESGY